MPAPKDDTLTPVIPKGFPPPSHITREEFLLFKDQTTALIKDLVAVVKSMPEAEKAATKVRDEVPVEVKAQDDRTPLSPKQQTIFERYFDPEDGFEAWLKLTDKTEFQISVPRKFSKESPAYWQFYKQALHNKVVKDGNIDQTIEEYCKAVATHLNYNRLLKSK